MDRGEMVAAREAQESYARQNAAQPLQEGVRFWRQAAMDNYEGKIKLEHEHAKLRHELFWWRILAWMGIAASLFMNVMFYVAAFVAPPAHWSMMLKNFLGGLS